MTSIERRILKILIENNNRARSLVSKYLKQYPDTSELEIRRSVWRLVDRGIIFRDSGYFYHYPLDNNL